MKKKLSFIALLSLLTLTMGACSVKGTPKQNDEPNTPTDPTDPSDPVDPPGPVDPDDPPGPDDPVDPPGPDDPDDPPGPVDPDQPKVLTIQDENILHAFNWSLTNIQNSLTDIKNAGFHTVQLSPMQPQKDYYNGSWSSQWWKLYQPLGFSVAGNNQNVLGNKSQLTSLCAAAKQKGINIIVDVVTNHLAGGDKNSLNGGVANYESDIYNNGLIHHTNKDANDNDLQSIVQGHIGNYPDLMTENTTVQNRVLSMLKEYVDCGISGFRFDAAKHIETPDDGNYASNYWPTIVNGINSYATGKGLNKPYIYGEILYQCGNGRSYSSYTKYMSVVDSSQGSAILNAVKNKSVSDLKTSYNSGVNPDHLVLWAESHDTYSNDSHETTNIPVETINKAYMIQASRKDAASLYLARPGGNMGSIGSTDYKKACISAINKFHTQYAQEGEAISTNNGVFINVRGNKNKGAALINVSDDSSSKTVSVNLANGSYVDLINEKKYNITNNSINVTFTDGACILVPESTTGSLPSVTINPTKTVFNDTTSVSINVSGATSAYYQINNGNQQAFSNSTSFTVGNGLSNGEITVKVVATNAAGSTIEQVKLVKTSLVNSTLIVTNVPNLADYSYLVWSWSNNNDGKWYDSSIDGNMMGFTFSNQNYIVVRFNKGTTSSNAKWDDKLGQTGDLTLSSQIVDYSSLGL